MIIDIESNKLPKRFVMIDPQDADKYPVVYRVTKTCKGGKYQEYFVEVE